MKSKTACGSWRRVGTYAGILAALAAPVAAQVTSRASVAADGAQGNSASDYASISADGRFVDFESLASNLVGADTNGGSDNFVRDRLSGTIERVSVDSSGVQANSTSDEPTISADQSRWYLVDYRDPTVLGGCPSSSTFNATQTGSVAWSL